MNSATAASSTAFSRRRQAVAAAQAVASRFGIDASRAQILKDSNNTVVHLAPAPLVAKVSTTTIRPDGAVSLSLELSVGVHLARRKAPIAMPATEVPVLVYRHSGHAMTFWRFHNQDARSPADAYAAARTLRDFQAALADYPGVLPSFLDSQLGRAEAVLHKAASLGALPAPDRDFLIDEHSRLAILLRDSRLNLQPLHGDPHRGNLLVLEGSCLLIDFEATCIGPAEWDLTALPGGGSSVFKPVDRQLLAVLNDVRSLCVAVWCWMQPGRAPEVDEAARFHLRALRRRARRRSRP